MKFLNFLDEHRGKVGITCFFLVTSLSILLHYGYIANKFWHITLAILCFAAIIIGAICFLLEAAEEWS